MLQLSMIDDNFFGLTRPATIRIYEEELTALSGRLFYAQMRLSKANRHGRLTEAGFYKAVIRQLRADVAVIQNDLYSIAPDRYPQFGALG